MEEEGFSPLSGSNLSYRAGKIFWRAQKNLQSKELLADMVGRGLQRGAANRPISKNSELREEKKTLKDLEVDP